MLNYYKENKHMFSLRAFVIRVAVQPSSYRFTSLPNHIRIQLHVKRHSETQTSVLKTVFSLLVSYFVVARRVFCCTKIHKNNIIHSKNRNFGEK